MSDQLYLFPDEGPGDRLTWSVSRHKRLRDCRRKYFLQHYGSRGGHKEDADPAVRDIYVLKHLRNRQMWVGEVVHEMIELALGAWRRGDRVPVEALVERGTRRMRAHYAESLQGLYRDRPRTSLGLVEHEYREEISREEWQEQRNRMERCLRSFFELELTERIRRAPAWRWLALESIGSFAVEGATVIVKPDFAWREEGESVTLVDWKTGKPRHEEEQIQLAVYGLFARRSWDAEAMRGEVVYLDAGESREVPLADEHLEQAEEEIRTSLKEMRRLATEVRERELDPPAFPKTDEVELCVRCNFRRTCGR